MPLNINPNYDSNNPTILLNTQIPALTEDADIQEALRLYHYGSTTPPALPSLINPESVAGYLKSLREDVTALQDLGIGSSYSNTLPTNVPDGYVWVNSDSAAPIFNNILLSAFQPSAPTNDLAEGMLWVDSDSSPLEIYVYDGTQWSPVTSGGSVSLGAYSEFNLTGTGTDVTGYDAVTAANIGLNTTVFGYLAGATPTPFAVTVVSTGMSKIELEFIFGARNVDGNIGIFRTINGDPLTATQIATTNTGYQIKMVDTHGQSLGTAITYTIANLDTQTITFDGDQIIQAIAKEVA